jgi:hypothetical protein
MNSLEEVAEARLIEAGMRAVSFPLTGLSRQGKANAIRQIIAAVAPLIAAAEREACAAMVESYQAKLAEMSGTVPGVLQVACITIAAAIRAQDASPPQP